MSRLLLFIHVPKASGSTIRSIISRNYPNHARAAFDEWNDVSFRRLAVAETTRIIIGHFRFGMHFGIMRPISYCAMIRNPIDRCISDFYYAFSSPSHRLREQITTGQMTLESFLQRADALALIRQVAGLEGIILPMEEGTAERIVSNSYPVVGIAERFEESILLIAHLNDWAPPIFITKNITKLSADVSAQRKAATNSLAPGILERFSRDMAFYRFCCAKLDESIALAGPNFVLALSAFRNLQQDIIRTANSLDLDEMYYQSDFRFENKLPEFAEKITKSEEYQVIREFIKSDSPLKQRPVGLLHGAIDHVRGRVVKGWALVDGSADPVELSIRDGGTLDQRVVASIRRPALRGAGFGSMNHGFEVDVGTDIGDAANISVAYDALKLLISPPPMMDGRRRAGA